MSDERPHWKSCSICKKPIGFGGTYQVCSVSTCNRKRTGLVFCSVACWDAHLPTARHRDAWAVERTAPTREDWEAEQRATAREPARRVVALSAAAADTPLAPPDVPREILIVASRLKQYVKARSGLRTSDGVLLALSELVRVACDEAIRRASADERQTVLDRDVPHTWRPE